MGGVPFFRESVKHSNNHMACAPDMRTRITHLCLVVSSAPKQPLTSVTSEASGSYASITLMELDFSDSTVWLLVITPCTVFCRALAIAAYIQPVPKDLLPSL